MDDRITNSLKLYLLTRPFAKASTSAGSFCGHDDIEFNSCHGHSISSIGQQMALVVSYCSTKNVGLLVWSTAVQAVTSASGPVPVFLKEITQPPAGNSERKDVKLHFTEFEDQLKKDLWCKDRAPKDLQIGVAISDLSTKQILKLCILFRIQNEL